MAERGRGERDRRLARPGGPSPSAGGQQAPTPGPIVQSFQASLYSGALPPPAMLEQFERVLPGAAERIFAMAEEQAAHRRHLERTVVAGGNRRAYCAIVTGTGVALAALGVAALAIVHGQSLAGVTTVVAAVGGLVGAFVYGSESRKRERLDKARIMRPTQEG